MQSKDKGATIEVDGEQVALGIPQVLAATSNRLSLPSTCCLLACGLALPPAWVALSPTLSLSPLRPLRCLPNCPAPQANAMSAALKQLIALGRVGVPEEAAGAMLLLASPYASYVTGQAVEVTGGGWL